MSVELLWENEGRTWHHTHRLLSKRCGQNNSRGFLEAEWLRLQASSAGGIGSIPGQGTKFPQATWCSKKIKKKKKRFYIERRYFLYPQKRIPEQPWTCAVNWTPSRGDDLNSSSELPCMWGARTCLRGASPHLNFLGLLSVSPASTFNGKFIRRTWITHVELQILQRSWARRAKPYATVGPCGLAKGAPQTQGSQRSTTP